MRTRAGAGVAVLTVTGVMIAALATGAVAGSEQRVRGQVLAPMGPRGLNGWALNACELAGATSSWAVNRGEVFEFRFPVHPATYGRRFTLTPDLPADLDIVFWNGSTRSFGQLGLARETGIVPSGAQFASVCLAAGGPTGFTYVAG